MEGKKGRKKEGKKERKKKRKEERKKICDDRLTLLRPVGSLDFV